MTTTHIILGLEILKALWGEERKLKEYLPREAKRDREKDGVWGEGVKLWIT